ncbi:MAG: alpha/beta hydrolase [Candidatus Saccharibacteria bacterium]|nr:alpha/beta hydrolase [Moraxellaceae bacterium]
MIESPESFLEKTKKTTESSIALISKSTAFLNRLKINDNELIHKIKNIKNLGLNQSGVLISDGFIKRNLATPDRVKTARELPQLSLDWPSDPSEAMQRYCAFYALDQLEARHLQGYLRAGDHRIHVQIFQPLIETVGTVWLLHGYLEHSGLYQPMIAELLAQNFAVITLDLPGHGLSSGEETGIAEFSVYQAMLKDVHEWVTQQQSSALPHPWLGIGQSTGCAIWMDHVLTTCVRKHSPIVERVLLISPLVRPAKSAWWQNPIGLSLIRQVKHNVPRKFRRNNSNPEYLRFVRLEDPLQSRKMAMSWILALSRWMPYMEGLPASRFPVWLVQGERDQTVDWRYNIGYVKRKFRLKVTLLLEDASHQLINECKEIRAPMTALIPVFLKGE